MKFKKSVHEHRCKSLSSVRVSKSNKIPILSEPINNHPNDSLAFRFRQSLYEVHINVNPRCSKYVQWLQLARISRSIIFVTLASITLVYKIQDVFSDSHPIEVSHHLPCSSINTKVVTRESRMP